MTDDNQADTQRKLPESEVSQFASPRPATFHSSTFEYLKPTEVQFKQMEEARQRAFVYANAIEALIPNGPDKTYMLRKFREVAMWANIAITRNPDGSPRT